MRRLSKRQRMLLEGDGHAIGKKVPEAVLVVELRLRNGAEVVVEAEFHGVRAGDVGRGRRRLHGERRVLRAEKDRQATIAFPPIQELGGGFTHGNRLAVRVAGLGVLVHEALGMIGEARLEQQLARHGRLPCGCRQRFMVELPIRVYLRGKRSVQPIDPMTVLRLC